MNSSLNACLRVPSHLDLFAEDDGEAVNAAEAAALLDPLDPDDQVVAGRQQVAVLDQRDIVDEDAVRYGNLRLTKTYLLVAGERLDPCRHVLLDGVRRV